jgi:hypothetical protein
MTKTNSKTRIAVVAASAKEHTMYYYVVKHPEIPGLVVVTSSLVGWGQMLGRFKTRRAAERHAALLNGTA